MSQNDSIVITWRESLAIVITIFAIIMLVIGYFHEQNLFNECMKIGGVFWPTAISGDYCFP